MLKDDMRDMDILYWRLRDEYISGPRPATGKLRFELIYPGTDESLIAQIGVPDATDTKVDATRDSTMYQKIEIPRGNWSDIWTRALTVNEWPEPDYWKISADAQGIRESAGYRPQVLFPYPKAIVRRFGEHEWRLVSDHAAWVTLRDDVIQTNWPDNRSDTLPIGDEEIENAHQAWANIKTLENNLRDKHLLGWDVYYFPAEYRPEGAIDITMLTRRMTEEGGIEALMPRVPYVSVAMGRIRSLAWQMYSILAEEVILRAH